MRALMLRLTLPVFVPAFVMLVMGSYVWLSLR